MTALSLSADGTTIELTGDLTHETVPSLYRSMTETITPATRDRIRRIGCSKIGRSDSAGVALIELIRERVGSHVEIEGAPEGMRDTLSLFTSHDADEGAKASAAPPRLLARSKERLRGAAGGLSGYIRVAADSMIWALFDVFGRRQRRRGSFVTQSVRIGVQSIGIIALLSFIIGFIVALQSAAQLRLFGANIYVVNLLALFVVREMGPLMTAVLVAGRSGSSIASEIATMKVTEELDALQVMGLSPVRYVVVPKVLAITAVMPVLTMVSMVVAILGGMAISLPYLDLTARTFLGQFVDVLSVYDLVTGFSKSVVFAWQIVIVAAYYGFRATGGAEGVGLVTTKSVVASIFSVIVIDVFFSFAYLT
jgi:phospholipid/cholesterol/gamma-HCH transport system permease protein